MAPKTKKSMPTIQHAPSYHASTEESTTTPTTTRLILSSTIDHDNNNIDASHLNATAILSTSSTSSSSCSRPSSYPLADPPKPRDVLFSPSRLNNNSNNYINSANKGLLLPASITTDSARGGSSNASISRALPSERVCQFDDCCCICMMNEYSMLIY